MTDAIFEGAIDEALRVWHLWAASGRGVEGYPTECPSCRMSKANRRNESQYEDAEAGADATIAQAVENIISGFDEPYKTALHIDARNQVARVKVWASARLPEDKGERMAVIAAAREMFAEAMLNDGIL